MSARVLLGAVVFGGFGCAERPSDSAAVAGEHATPPAPADSLVATAPGGAEVWFTLARPDSADGRHCVDRAIEIRRGGTRVPVPLLYAGESPEILNDTTLRAPGSGGDQRVGRPRGARPFGCRRRGVGRSVGATKAAEHHGTEEDARAHSAVLPVPGSARATVSGVPSSVTASTSRTSGLCRR